MPFHRLSLVSARALPNDCLFSSARTGWTSLLVERHSCSGASVPFHVPPTPDQTIVLALRNDHDLEVLRGRRWQSSVQRAGDLGTTAPGEACRLRWNSHRPDAVFETAHLYIPVDAIREAREEFRRAGQHPRPARLSALSLHDDAVRSSIAALLAAGAEGAPDFYAASALPWIVARLLRADGGPARRLDESGSRTDDRRIGRAMEALAASIETAPTLDWLASEAGVSKFHLVRLFRRRTGRTPWRYLLDLRMERARTLLAGSELPVSVVAVRCGYARPNNFAAAFSRYHGVAPRAFRSSRD
ncbi:MAG: helix-turn-helix transcriptional regulator [Gluconacetobacter diazotrophicus]|nr:helix-turn-helix transcriptional regulator [Gluconacetobacter diazotrophicus]